jgi:hypothetical protein
MNKATKIMVFMMFKSNLFFTLNINTMIDELLQRQLLAVSSCHHFGECVLDQNALFVQYYFGL